MASICVLCLEAIQAGRLLIIILIDLRYVQLSLCLWHRYGNSCDHILMGVITAVLSSHGNL